MPGEPDATSPPRRDAPWTARAAYALALALACTPWCSASIALLGGIALGLLNVRPFERAARLASRYLIQACIVLLGLRLELSALAVAAWSGLALAVGTILGTLALGAVGARVLRCRGEVATLVSAGTAICGGSAIAAVGSAIGAAGSSIAIATGVVFVLNAAAFYLLPLAAHALDLSPTQFGVWCGVAIHDMASVNGAAGSWGAGSAGVVDTANVVKLTRVLWIAPIAMLASVVVARRGGAARAPLAVPWFIVLFVGASVVRTLVPGVGERAGHVAAIAAIGFQGALFMIGSAVSREVLRTIGWRALVLAIVLWLAIAAGSLLVIKATVA